MINYREPVDFSQTVYTVDCASKKIIEHTLRDLCLEHAEETTTPHGIGKTYHTRGNELWTWGYCGNNPKIVETFDSDEEAEHAAMLSYLFDMEQHVDAPTVYYTLGTAQAALHEYIEENE